MEGNTENRCGPTGRTFPGIEKPQGFNPTRATRGVTENSRAAMKGHAHTVAGTESYRCESFDRVAGD
jgi:hypothetical protein